MLAFLGATRPSRESFDDLAARVLALQLRHHSTYAELAASRGVEVAALEQGRCRWTEAPPMPTSAFAHLPLYIGTPETTFRSSGTTRDGAPRSAHHHTALDLYRRIIDRSFPQAVLGGAEPPLRSCTILSLIPPTTLVADSSLGFMVGHVMERWANDRSLYAFEDQRLAPDRALGWLQTVAPESDRPVVLTTALALWAVLDAGGQHARSTPWPENLQIMETGGFKTERFRLTREDLLRRLHDRGVGPEQVVREYGMTELTSQAYSAPNRSSETFELPHWARVRALDPESLEDVESGQPGLLAFLDLGNVGSAAYVLTEDLGRLPASEPPVGGRFELLGRARDAQLRGCSLTTEQLLRP